MSNDYFINSQNAAEGWQLNLPAHEREGSQFQRIEPNPRLADPYTPANPSGNPYAAGTKNFDLYKKETGILPAGATGTAGFASQSAPLPDAASVTDPLALLKRLEESDNDYFEPVTDMTVKPDTPHVISETVTADNPLPDEKPMRVINQAPRPRTRRNRNQSTQTDNLTPENAPAAPAPRRRQSRSGQILAIDGQRSVETREDKLRNDLLDMVESQKGRKILTGVIQGVERSEQSSIAVIYHGEIKVIIPAEEAVTKPDDLRGRPYADVMNYLLTKRLGAEIDFVVKGVDIASGIAAGSRLEAMALKRRQYYFGSDRDGNNLIFEGLTAEARVVSVIRAGIFVDLFGLETYIQLRELSYQRWSDAGAYFEAGQRVLVKILKLDRADRENIKVSASVKQAAENPYEQALKRYQPDSRYVGTVSMVDTNGVFVSLEGGVDCLCTHPQRGRPARGSKVTVRIIGINHESKRIWGAITHMTSPR